MIVYIAGQMTGDPGYRKKFSRAESVLKGEGYQVINPAYLPESLTREKVMPICLKMLEAADAICVLDDWHNSIGAREEMRAALEAGKAIYILHYVPRVETMLPPEAENWRMELEVEV